MIDNNIQIQNSIDLATQNSEVQMFNNIKQAGSEKEQLKKVTKEFEAIFITKLLNTMEKTVDKEGSLFSEGKYMQNFKSIVFNELGRQISQSPNSNVGFANKMYAQMEKFVKG